MSAYLQEFLTPKQQVFCDEYLIDMNATRAALRAGYAKSVALNGQVMQMPKIKLYLESKMTDRAERCNYTADMVLRELGKIAFGNMRDYFDGEGNMKPMHLVDDDAKAALWSLSVTDAGSGGKKQAKGEVTKFRMYNKLAALDKIAKHINFYKPDMKKEVVYRYLDKEQMEEEPWFENFKDELEERRESRVKDQDFLEVEDGDKIEMQESRCEHQDFLKEDGLCNEIEDAGCEVQDSFSSENLPAAVVDIAAVAATVRPVPDYGMHETCIQQLRAFGIMRHECKHLSIAEMRKWIQRLR